MLGQDCVALKNMVKHLNGITERAERQKLAPVSLHNCILISSRLHLTRLRNHAARRSEMSELSPTTSSTPSTAPSAAHKVSRPVFDISMHCLLELRRKPYISAMLGSCIRDARSGSPPPPLLGLSAPCPPCPPPPPPPLPAPAPAPPPN